MLFMADEEKKEDIDVEEKDEGAADDSEASEDADEEKADDSSKDSDKKEASDEIDYEKELEAEKKRGKPDPAKAQEAFKKRQDREEGADGDEDKPLTQKDIGRVTANVRRELQAEQAFTLARSMAASDTEANLIVAKWGNRIFPDGTSLQDQIEEAYAITHRKSLIGQRNEALRALKNKGTVKKDGSGAHRDASPGSAPKMSAADAEAYRQAGFVYDGAKRLFKKPLRGGKVFLYKDPKTNRQWTGQA